MRPARHILLTFDHELYLGARSGTLEKCILEPTSRIEEVLSKHDAKGIFFVDTLGLLRCREERSLENACRLVLDQLVGLFKKGHYIFPHLHPHWLDARYLTEQKQFDLSNLRRYSLASLPETTVRELLGKSQALLKSAGITYASWGYRAGGWCIQPFSRYKGIFRDEHILHDFSVLPGYQNEHSLQQFDFTKVVFDQPYSFAGEVEVPEKGGKFIEYPISCIDTKDSLKQRILQKYLWISGDRGWGDGLSAQTASLASRIAGKEMVSIDLLTSAKLARYARYLEQNTYMHWISHPKMLRRHSLRAFDKFLARARARYECDFDFTHCTPIN